MMELVSLLRRRETRVCFLPNEDSSEGSHLQTQKRALTKNQIFQRLDLGLSRLKNCEKESLLLNNPAFGILLWQPKLRHIVILYFRK